MRRLNENRNIFDFAEKLSESHNGNLVSAVLIGIVAAAALAIYGSTCIVTQHATFIGSRPLKVVSYAGIPAICLGVAYIAAALFMHCHFVWFSDSRFHAIGEIGKLISAAGVVLAIVYLLYYVIAFM
ncbi:MAG: hypothetical protein KDB27_15220 [Planctomycetales bacterium]|nr:hypothetical protein [Planctomycetales bacterium]